MRLLTLEGEKAFSAEELGVLRHQFNLEGMGPATPSGSRGPWRWLHRLQPRLANSLAHNWDGSRSRFAVDQAFRDRVGLQQILADVDLVVGRYTHSLTRLGLVHAGIPTVLDVDDLGSDVYRSRLESGQNSFVERQILNRHYANIKSQEPNIFRDIDDLWIANPTNRSFPGLENSTFLPNIPFVTAAGVPNEKPVDQSSRRVVCVASYGHRPNVEGVDWFLDDVWGSVLAAVPEARFVIYGSGLSDALRERWAQHPNVEVAGFVEDIATAYEDSTLAICPVQSGAGTNIKVLEAGAHRRNCVVTRMAARGLDADPQLAAHLTISDSAEAMAGHVTTLLNDSALNQRLADDFRDAVLAGYSFERFATIVAETIQGLGGTHPSSPPA